MCAEVQWNSKWNPWKTYQRDFSFSYGLAKTRKTYSFLGLFRTSESTARPLIMGCGNCIDRVDDYGGKGRWQGCKGLFARAKSLQRV